MYVCGCVINYAASLLWCTIVDNQFLNWVKNTLLSLIVCCMVLESALLYTYENKAVHAR